MGMSVKKFTVVPKLPDELVRLGDLANNLWWCWDPEAIELFFRIDRDLWTATNQNPKAVLGRITQARLAQLAEDDSYRAHLDRVTTRFDQYMRNNKWHERHPETGDDFRVAYLSAEFGLLESISIYSGGLGVLAGDYLKAASDMGMPMIGIGLLYRQGYFRQYLNADGWQQEEYPENDFYNMPIELVRDESGKPVIVEVAFPHGPVKIQVWKCQVGRVPLYLLDCDFEENRPADRDITGQLYGGDRDMRVRQEMVLGIGGVHALRALGIRPSSYHMNEGHSAFMTLERVRDVMRRDSLTFDQALDAVRAGSVFTTHTPVPAGNDMFEPALIERYFSNYVRDVGISMNQLLALGRQDPSNSHEPFCMTVLALKLSSGANGVSKLHGKVARNMWTRTWPGIPENEVPITSITNGVHTRFWISRDLAGLYDRYIGPAWINTPDRQQTWNRIAEVPDTELWRTHERRRERLVNFARRRLTRQMRRRSAPESEVVAANEVLDPETLTLGFARRFATYKRANLLLMDPERFVDILTNHDTPVQLIVAGKAHPQDTQAKELIRNLVHFARDKRVRNHVVFIEDYDINVARYMVQGVDCWLNTPRRPMEASGTSGMKAAANGALNISIPDGWWCEAETLGENGWSIGRGETYNDPREQDTVESKALYEILEKEVVPMFYDRKTGGIPREWVKRMKTSICTICPVFNSHRMLEEYAQRFYIPYSIRRNELRKDNRKRSLALTAWKQKVARCWSKVSFIRVESGPTEGLPFGSELPVTAELNLNELTCDDVEVEIYYGSIARGDAIVDAKTAPMSCTKQLDSQVYRFEGSIPCDRTGQQGFTVRVIPRHEDLGYRHETGLITWA